MAVRDRVRWTSLHAVAAENTTRIVNVVNVCVALASRNAIRVRVFCCFDVDAIRWTRRRAQEASNALLQPIFVAMQHVNSAITRLEMHRLVRVILCDGFPENIPESHAEPFHKCFERLTHFTQY